MRNFIIIVFCSLLAACATQTEQQKQRQELALAKANYTVHNYQLAYTHLAPLAAKGDRDAQYAVGYMYYYGYGVQRNESLAKAWIKKAAANHQVKAARAMHQLDINSDKPFYAPFVS